MLNTCKIIWYSMFTRCVVWGLSLIWIHQVVIIWFSMRNVRSCPRRKSWTATAYRCDLIPGNMHSWQPAHSKIVMKHRQNFAEISRHILQKYHKNSVKVLQLSEILPASKTDFISRVEPRATPSGWWTAASWISPETATTYWSRLQMWRLGSGCRGINWHDLPWKIVTMHCIDKTRMQIRFRIAGNYENLDHMFPCRYFVVLHEVSAVLEQQGRHEGAKSIQMLDEISPA